MCVETIVGCGVHPPRLSPPLNDGVQIPAHLRVSPYRAASPMIAGVLQDDPAKALAPVPSRTLSGPPPASAPRSVPYPPPGPGPRSVPDPQYRSSRLRCIRCLRSCTAAAPKQNRPPAGSLPLDQGQSLDPPTPCAPSRRRSGSRDARGGVGRGGQGSAVCVTLVPSVTRCYDEGCSATVSWFTVPSYHRSRAGSMASLMGNSPPASANRQCGRACPLYPSAV